MIWRFAIVICFLVKLKGRKKGKGLNDIKVTAYLMTIIINIPFNMNTADLLTHS